MRVYILEGQKLNPRDTNGKSDPYLALELGPTKVDNREEHFKRVTSASF